MTIELQLNKYEPVIKKAARKFARMVHEDYEDLAQDMRIKVWELIVDAKAINEAYVYTALKHLASRKMSRNNKRYEVGVIGSYLVDAMPNDPEAKEKNEDVGSISALVVNHETELKLHRASCVKAVHEQCNSSAKRVLILMTENPFLTQTAIAETLNLSRRTVCRAVREINELTRTYDSELLTA